MSRQGLSSTSPDVQDHSAEISYIKAHVNSILSEMMVKILNEEPNDILTFMLQFLRAKRELRRTADP